MRIHFKDMDASQALVDDIERRVKRLTERFPRIIDVRITIQGPAHNRTPWRTTVDVLMPGAELVIHADSADPYVAAHEALAITKREVGERIAARVSARLNGVNAARRASTTSSAGSSPQAPEAPAPR